MKRLFNVIIFLLFGIWGAIAQTEVGTDGYNPDSPGNPGTPNKPEQKYTLSCRVVPASAGYLDFKDKECVEGEQVYINVNPHFDYVFEKWTEGDSVVSYEQNFNYTMPGRDVTLKAHFRYDPLSPDNPNAPEEVQKVLVSLTANPSHGGSFNFTAQQIPCGTDAYLYAYPRINYDFEGWYENGKLLSRDNPHVYRVGETDVNVVGRFVYNPKNPHNSNTNSWNSETGVLIIDDFIPGYLNSAIDAAVGGWDYYNNVTHLIVAGKMNPEDWGFAWNLQSCATIDLQRTYGYTEIPSYTFYGCPNLQTFIIPSCVENIGYGAFYNSLNLKDVICHAVNPPTVETDAFFSIADNPTLRVLASSVPLYKEALGWEVFNIQPLTYHVTFNVDGKLYYEADVNYGDPVVAPDAPEKEGYTFVTWGKMPEIMPARNLEFNAQYEINYYNVKFVADDAEVFSESMAYGSPIVAPDAPAKEGHTFVTWGDVPATVPAHDVLFTAEYKVNKYHLKFVADDVVVSETDVDYGSEIAAPAAPAKEGYTFKTWGDVPATMPAKDLEFVAQYDVNYYMVKFVADDAEVFSESMAYGSEIVAPDAPAKEGHTFVTWGDVPATVPAHDLLFTAEYKINQYHLKFVADDVVIMETDIDYDSEIVAPDAPVKEGYTFKTWGDVPATMPAKDLEFVAQYDVNYYMVKFVADDAEVFSESMAYGSEIVAPDAPAKEGHTFVTWGDVPATVPAHDLLFTAEYKVNKYHLKFVADDVVVSETDVDYGSEIVAPDAPVKEGYTFKTWGDVPATMPAKDLEFTAQYGVNVYTVKFIADGVEVYSQKQAYGSEIVVPEAPAKEGYSFVTWGDVPETVPAHDVEFTAEYKVNQYHIKFIAEGVVVSEADLDYGAKITVPDAPAKEGYVFVTWGDVPETMPAKNLEFTAQYDKGMYNVKFVAEGKVVFEQKMKYGDKIVVPEAPAKEGYSFVTWGDVPATVPAHDVEFTAEYKVNQYHIKFIAEGVVISEADLDYGAKITVPDAPVKEGYTFVTWGDVPATMPAKDLEFTAEYTVNQYTVFYYVDGELYDKQTVSYGAAIEPVAAPEKTGYEFLGWENVPETMPAHDIDIQGKMKAVMYKVTYILNDEYYGEQYYAYGEVITPLEVEVEDYETFSGWQDLPETMPAEDITVYGVLTITDAIDAVLMDMGEVTIYTINGNLLYRNVMYKDVVKKLRPGMYIINGRKVAIK